MTSQSMGELRWWNNPRVVVYPETNELTADDSRANRLERIVPQIHVRVSKCLRVSGCEQAWCITLVQGALGHAR